MAPRTSTSHPRITKEFRDILPGLTGAEFTNLEADILNRGILHPILVWNNICIDGMHRLRIAKKHNLKYTVKQLRFDSKEDAKVWVFEHQAGKRNQSTFSKIAAGLKFEKYYKEKAKENQRRSPGRGKKGSPKIGESIDTLRIIAQKVGVAHSYVSDVKFILKHGSADLIQKCHAGELSIRNAYYAAKSHAAVNRKHSGTVKSARYSNPKTGEYINQIIKGDCIEIMRQMARNGLKEEITNIICSPPYNTGKNYGKTHNDNLPYSQYLKWLGKVLLLSSRLLRPGGRLIWVVADAGNRQDEDGDSYCHPIYADLVNKVRELDCGLRFRGSIIWAKGTGVVNKTAFGSYKSAKCPILRSNHEYIMIWSKGQWDLPNVSNMESDIGKQEFLDWTYTVWNIPPSTDRQSSHPCSFPEELAERLIKLYSFPGDIILDNFVGSGTSCVAAARLDRRWIGIDQNARYCRYARERTEMAVSCRKKRKSV